MTSKKRNPDFEQTLQVLRGQGFEVLPGPGQASATLVMNGAAAVLTAVPKAAPAISAGPGAWIGNKLARLVDRGYQKFLQTEEFELPATADRLMAIHAFDQKLRLCLGAPELFNESLGTTSQLYQYDRLNSRLPAAAPAPRPWDSTSH